MHFLSTFPAGSLLAAVSVTIWDWVSENLVVLSDWVCTDKNHTGMVAAMVGEPAGLGIIENLAERSSGGHLAKLLSQSGITTAAPSSIPSSTWSLNTSKGGDPTASPRVQNRQPGPVLIYPPCEQILFFRCNQNFRSLNLLPLVCNNRIVFVVRRICNALFVMVGAMAKVWGKITKTT